MSPLFFVTSTERLVPRSSSFVTFSLSLRRGDDDNIKSWVGGWLVADRSLAPVCGRDRRCAQTPVKYLMSRAQRSRYSYHLFRIVLPSYNQCQ